MTVFDKINSLVDELESVGIVPVIKLDNVDDAENLAKALRDDGIMVNQHESPFYEADALAMQRAHGRIIASFPLSRVYQAHIPTYPSGHWLFGFSSKKYHPVKDLRAAEWNSRGLATRYYTTNLHRGAFALPAYVEKLLEDMEGVE